MAVALTNLDIGTRYALEEDFTNGFVGRDRQIVIKTDDPKGYRPVIMDGTTQGGKNKVALVDDLADYVPVTTYNSDKADFVTTSTLTSSLATKANTSHTHAQSDVTGLSDALAAKANTSHSHNQSDVVGLDTALAGKAAASHTHTKAEVTDFAHTHATSEVTGLDTALAAKADSSALTSLIPKAGARGQLAGYESITEDTQNLTITASSPDDQITSGTVTVSAISQDSTSWTKTVLLTGASPQVSLDPSWAWVGGSAPTLTQYGLLVLAKRNGVGIANFVGQS